LNCLPVGVSSGQLTWQVKQSSPVWRAKLGTALAWGAQHARMAATAATRHGILKMDVMTMSSLG
jgi:hypothetical protein